MIQIEHISHSFSKQKVLSDVSLTCEQAKIQALLGANGAGKSTLIHIISQLLMPDKGTFYIEGECINSDTYEYRKKVGYVFEHPIYAEKLTVKEYLQLVAKLYQLPEKIAKYRIEELLHFFELENETTKSIQHFSKGMKSKVSLAASLVHSPKYLIYDEPFDGIDFLMSRKLIQLFKDMASKGATFLISSHQFDLIAELADNFAILQNGKITLNRSYQSILDDASLLGLDVKFYIHQLMTETPTRKAACSE